MPTLLVKEREKHRHTNAREGERKYVISYDDNSTLTETAALVGLLNTGIGGAPLTLGNLSRVDLECEVDEIATNIFEGVAHFALPQFEQPAAGQVSISFDISGQQTRIKQLRDDSQHVLSVAAGDFTLQDFRGAIGVSGQGSEREVEGVDVLSPQLCYTITKTIAEDDLDPAYVQTIANAVGTTNDDTYQGFTENTLLLVRASGTPRPDPANAAAVVYDITFQFAYSPTRTNITIGGLEVEEVQGWDYVWVYYETSKDSSTNRLLPTPKQVNVERLYPQTDFDDLELF